MSAGYVFEYARRGFSLAFEILHRGMQSVVDAGVGPVTASAEVP